MIASQSSGNLPRKPVAPHRRVVSAAASAQSMATAPVRSQAEPTMPGKTANDHGRHVSDQFSGPSFTVLHNPPPPPVRHYAPNFANPEVRWHEPSPLPAVRHANSGVPTYCPPPPNNIPEDIDEAGKRLKKKSWYSLPKSSSSKPRRTAWFFDSPDQSSYNLDALIGGRRDQGLWDEQGDALIYLFPRGSGVGPSFKVKSALFASSKRLTSLARKRRSLDNSSSQHDSHHAGYTTPPESPSSSPTYSGRNSTSRHSSEFEHKPTPEVSIYVPITLSCNDAADLNRGLHLSDQDVNTLVTVRNVFAFLAGIPLVAIEKIDTFFRIFIRIAAILDSFEFTNIDGSTFGELPNSRFEDLVKKLSLADCRVSPSKTVEALVLGEKLRSSLLYNEAFAHAVGKYEEITRATKDPELHQKFEMLSGATVHRLGRASIEHDNRLHGVNTRLANFDFPSIFAGIGNSKTTPERKFVNFDAWKEDFSSVRKHVLSYYKQKYGAWPPKASSKKNDFSTSGLNRIVLQSLYNDFTDWYDLMVDRSSITTRDVRINSALGTSPAQDAPSTRVLRRILDEYDRSHPPVQPPIPFDVPILPSLALTRPIEYGPEAMDDVKARSKKPKEEEMANMLKLTCNIDILRERIAKSPFLASIRRFEQKQAKGRTVSELVDLRAGMWIFMYAVIQALPMLVTDAPGVHFSQGVEYFLCHPVMGGLPWSTTDSGARVKKSWYGVAGSAGIVSLPSDLVEHGVDGVYRRSHCWQVAQQWAEQQQTGNGNPNVAAAMGMGRGRDISPPASVPTQNFSRKPSVPTPPPSGRASMSLQHQNGSHAQPWEPVTPPQMPQTRSARASIFGPSLAALPVPNGVAPVIASSPSSSERVSLDAYEHGMPGIFPATRAERGSVPSVGGASRNNSVAQTFDDILSSIEKDKGKDKEKEKRRKK